VRLRRLLLLVGVAAIAAGCGVPTPAAPTAKDVLAKPQQSDLKDAHFNVTGKITDNGTTVDLVGDGALTYKPKLAGRFKFTTNVGGQTVTIQEISVDGTNYGMTPASAKWVATKSSSGIDPSAFAGTTEQKYVGEENLPQGKAWHATAKDKDGNAFDAYIREKDGYPIKYVETQTGGQNITLTFDKYNSGETISAPPADQVQQG
jgi:outer membrane lipoprotein-sorting protein